MAIEHPEAAFELAENINEPNQKAWAYGMMAKRFSKSNRVNAKRALEKAISTLTNTPEGSTANWLHPSSTLGGLLPVVENVSPEQIESAIWQVVFLAIPHSRWSSQGSSKTSILQNAAASIARYDLKIASQLIGTTEVEILPDPTRAVANQFVLAADKLPDFLRRLDNQRHSGAFHPRQVVCQGC